MVKDQKTFILYIRNFIFGAEDSLVSTVGLLAGIATSGMAQREIVVAGIVLICVEAFSMSVGSFLTESATGESESSAPRVGHKSIIAAIIMFLSYFICGLIPLSPYILIPDGQAFWISITASVVSLFILGLVSAKILKIKILRNAFRMFVIGGLAIALGVAVGVVFK